MSLLHSLTFYVGLCVGLMLVFLGLLPVIVWFFIGSDHADLPVAGWLTVGGALLFALSRRMMKKDVVRDLKDRVKEARSGRENLATRVLIESEVLE